MMKNATTSERLKYVMNEAGLRQTDILQKCKRYCDQYGVRLGKNDLSQYVSGKVEPRQDKLSILGLALDVSEAWLMGYDVPMKRNDNIKGISSQAFPLLGEIACSNPIVTNEQLDCYIASETKINADFCLIAKGDSMMNARIYDGDIVFIRRQDTVKNGDIAAVIIDDEATLKRVFQYPKQKKLVLQAENPSCEPLVYVGEELNRVKIVGKAIYFQSKIN